MVHAEKVARGGSEGAIEDAWRGRKLGLDTIVVQQRLGRKILS